MISSPISYTVAILPSRTAPERLKQSDDDIDILKAYLKTQRAPKATNEALEDLTVDQHKAWKMAVGKIKKVLGE